MSTHFTTKRAVQAAPPALLSYSIYFGPTYPLQAKAAQKAMKGLRAAYETGLQANLAQKAINDVRGAFETGLQAEISRKAINNIRGAYETCLQSQAACQDFRRAYKEAFPCSKL
jgi:hypothetical protein